MTTYAQVCRSGHILNHSTNTEWIAGEHNYCQDCGAEGITECPDCQENHIVVSDEVLSSDAELGRSDLPLYCGNCGTAFPWTGEGASPHRSGQAFVEPRIVEERYYMGIVAEINRVYRVGADSATLVLVRKAIENSIIDILRNEYGMQEVDLFYNSELGQLRGLSELSDTLDERLNGFEEYNVATNQTLITRINELKENGNTEAHSIASDYSQDEMDEYSRKANFVLNTLFELRRRTREENS